ncbi:MAG: hypothetical protein ACKVKQ_08455 [Flavobacteriales bacterium]
MKRVRFILLIIFCICKLQAQNIINGSFENNTATSFIYDLSNAQYNFTIASSSSFGLHNYGEIDLLKTGGGYWFDTTWIAEAQEGDWFISPGAMGDHHINLNGDTMLGWVYQDAFSLELDDTLSIGSWYTLSFYSKHKHPLGSFLYASGRLSVGMSHYADSFGVVIDTTAYTDTAWAQHSVHFQATSNFEHITCRPVREKIGANWAFVDNFSLRLDSTGTYIPPPASWNCLATACIDPANGNGTYTTLAACQTACITSAINELQGEKQLLKIVDILGKESKPTATGLLFYIYSDGTVEKKVFIE